MSFKEVKELRAQGKIQEALALALQDYDADTNNIWNKRALSWVYYDCLKVHVDAKNKEQFLHYLSKVKELDLPEDEKLFFENVVWPVAAMLRYLAAQLPVDNQAIHEIFQLIREFPFPKPSKHYSALLNALHKAFKDNVAYLQVLDWWNLDNLLPEDYQETVYEQRKIMALAEQVYIAYAKNLLAQIQPISGINRADVLRKIQTFMPKLDEVILNHPNYVYPSFFKAKLLLAQGSTDVMHTFLPFAKQKKNDFWVWQLMAEIHKNDPDIVFSCYCKALSLRTPAEFLVKIRQQFAEQLVQRGMYNEAKTEIEAIVKVKTETGTKLSNQVVAWQQMPWYKEASVLKNNSNLYAKYEHKATDLLFQDEPEELIVIEFVNTEKKIANFIKDKSKYGFFKYDHVIKHPKIGDRYQVRFVSAKENMYKVATARKDMDNNSPALKRFTGALRMSPAGFGFVEDIFLDKSLLEQHKLEQGSSISGSAVLSYNKKKDDWGWKALLIDR